MSAADNDLLRRGAAFGEIVKVDKSSGSGLHGPPVERVYKHCAKVNFSLDLESTTKLGQLIDAITVPNRNETTY